MQIEFIQTQCTRLDHFLEQKEKNKCFLGNLGMTCPEIVQYKNVLEKTHNMIIRNKTHLQTNRVIMSSR